MYRGATLTSFVLVATNVPLVALASYVTAWIRITGPDDMDTALVLPPVTHDRLYVIGYVFSDQPSITNGFQIQYSVDGSTVGHLTRTTEIGNEYISFRSLLRAKYVRLSYTNDATPQTIFELHARLANQ